jgi:hypothetical protein
VEVRLNEKKMLIFYRNKILIYLCVSVFKMPLLQGGYSQNFLRKFVKISVALGLNILRFYRSKVFSKQILVEVDVIYYKSNEIHIFYV